MSAAAWAAEWNWIGYKVQPQISGQVFKNVSQSGVLAGAAPGLPGALAGTDAGLGARGAVRFNVIWLPNFSSFLDIHAFNRGLDAYVQYSCRHANRRRLRRHALQLVTDFQYANRLTARPMTGDPGRASWH